MVLVSVPIIGVSVHLSLCVEMSPSSQASGTVQRAECNSPPPLASMDVTEVGPAPVSYPEDPRHGVVCHRLSRWIQMLGKIWEGHTALRARLWSIYGGELESQAGHPHLAGWPWGNH